MNTRHTILVALAAVVIFAAGVITGGLLVNQTRPHAISPGGVPFLGRVEAISRAVSQLNLSAEQKRRVTEILRNGREQIADCFMILEPDIQQVFRDMRRQVQAELSPAQRNEFEELLRKRQQRPFDRRSPADATTNGASPAPAAR